MVFFDDFVDLMQAAITQIWDQYPDAVSFLYLVCVWFISSMPRIRTQIGFQL